MSEIDWDARIDWSNNGVFTGTGEDVTEDVLTGTGDVTVTLGRDTSRAFSPVATSRAQFDLDNVTKDYSPENGSSPIAGNVLPGRQVKFEATHNSTTYGFYRGYISLDDFEVDPQEKIVRVGCLDALARFKGVKISTQVRQGITTGQALGYILDAVGWPAPDRDLDPGATVIAHWWEEGTEFEDAVRKVVSSEGSPAMAFVGSDGSFVFRDRHHRLIRSASTTSQATFRDATEPIFSAPFGYDHGWRDIVNDVSFEVQERRAEASGEVWSTDDILSIAASSSITINVQTSDPFISAVTPVVDTDYRIRSGSVSSVTLSRTSGQSTIITFNAGGSGASIDQIRLRAVPLPVVRTYKITASDSTSQGKFGQRSMPTELEPTWANRHDAKAIADLLILQRKDPVPTAVLTLDGGNNDTCVTQQLARDLSDRVTVIETETALNDPFYLERIEHTISEAGMRLTTRFHCEMVPTQPVAGFILGTDLLNTGVLGY